MANDLSAFKAEAWSKLIIQNLDKVNVMMPLVNRDYEGEIEDVGSTVWVRTFGSVTLSSYAKGATLSYQDLTPVKESLVVGTSKYFAFNVDDIDKAQNDIDALEGYTMRAAVALNDEVEFELLSNWATAPNANKVTGGSFAAIALTSSNIYQYIVEARTRLAKQNVPAGMGRWMVVDPDTVALLLQSSQFLKATDLGDQVTVGGSLGANPPGPGFLGRCAGFDIYETNNVPTGTDNGVAGTFLQFGFYGCISYAAQIVEIEALRLQTTFANAVRGLILHESKIFTEHAKGFGYIKKA